MAFATTSLGRFTFYTIPGRRALRRARRLAAALTLLALILALATPTLATNRCIVGDNGTGTADFPPYAPLGYTTPRDIELISDGFPVGSMLLGRMSLVDIIDGPSMPGGGLGGMTHQFGGLVRLDLRGIGTAAGYSRVIYVPINNGEAHTSPIVPFDPVQHFSTDLFQLFARIPPGDPDFDLLRITSGSSFFLPGPGRTRLDRLPSGDWSVDSFFDITYRIDFVGAPGGPFAGMSGSTTAQSRLQEGQPLRKLCTAPDAGGTARFPSDCGPYRSHPEADLIRDGLPAGQAINGTMHLTNMQVTTEVPGGQFGGDTETFDAVLSFEMRGSGSTLGGFNRAIFMMVSGQTVSGPRVPGQVEQGFPAELEMLQGQIPLGDPDFDLLRITAGTSFGLPSPGHTTLTQLPGGNWAVDSFFDITYRIDFVGAPGGPLAGMSGSTTRCVRFDQGGPVRGNPCLVPVIGGTADLPPPCPAGHQGPPTGIIALNGLPVGSPLLGTMTLGNLMTTLEVPGGSLDGTVQDFQGFLRLNLEGVGMFAGYMRNIFIPVNGRSEAAQRIPGSTPQSIPMLIDQLGGFIIGDPDFDLLRITAGNGFGLPTPGHTLLTLPSAMGWQVDSFFDITYRIDFVGAPGGPFAGMSGSTTGTVRMRAGMIGGTSAAPEAPRAMADLTPATPNPTAAWSQVQFRLDHPARVRAAIFDVSGRRLRDLIDAAMPAGEHRLAWDGLDGTGTAAPSGLYFYKLEMGGKSRAQRVVVNR